MRSVGTLGQPESKSHAPHRAPRDERLHSDRPPVAGPPRAASRLLGTFFALAASSPQLAVALRPLVVPLVPLFSAGIRASTRCNAGRIFGRPLGPAEQRAFTRQVVANFYAFVTDLGRVSRLAADARLPDDLVGNVSGESEYRAVRAGRRGAVLATAHLGSFEAGLLALRRVEPIVHVVFKRDPCAPFERMRSALRRSLGVREAPVDDGLPTWLRLRDALLRNEVVVMQADRALPGQQSAVVTFLGGSLRVPTGPARLARLTGSPIVPVFAVRRADGRHDIHLGRPIDANEPGSAGGDGAVLALARAIEAVVAKHPAQWLVLDTVFEEDRRAGR
ncbi:MAG: lysophospholipid acyltransferase family protein [Phycisphaerales bacterium]